MEAGDRRAQPMADHACLPSHHSVRRQAPAFFTDDRLNAVSAPSEGPELVEGCPFASMRLSRCLFARRVLLISLRLSASAVKLFLPTRRSEIVSLSNGDQTYPSYPSY
jgi:hypothetical protein